MMNNEKILEVADELESYVIECRRIIHEYAETNGNEFQTRQLVEEKMKEDGIVFEELEGTGLIGILDTGKPGPHIALRADMDALPMPEEENNLAGPRNCRSKTPESSCHACGHDGHTAMLLGSMRALAQNKDQLTGTIYFCFEQGEEVGGGIEAMLRGLEKYQIDAVWGIHVWSDLPSGTICVQEGPRMAGGIGVDLTFKGKGGHGSRPDQSVNPVYCAANWLNNIAVAFANQIDANQTVTLGITSIQGGEVSNVIPDDARVIGSFRLFDKAEGEKAYKILKETAEHTAAMHHCAVEYGLGCRIFGGPVVNDAYYSALAESALVEVLPEGAVVKSNPWFGSESFGRYIDKYGGVFAHLGINNPEYGSGAAHHNGFFDIDESVLKLGMISTLKYIAAIEEKGVKKAQKELQSLTSLWYIGTM